MKIQPCIIFDFSELPANIKDIVKDRHSFRNDIHLEFLSEFSPTEEGETWGETLSEQEIEKYWIDQTKCNNYKGSLDQFIIDYGLIEEKWILSLGLDLSKVEKILYRICL